MRVRRKNFTTIKPLFLRFLYDIGIFCYTLAVWLAAPFNAKARLWIRGRRGIFSQIEQQCRDMDRPVWFHCASLGEFEMVRPLIETLREKRPSVPVVLTFFSPSGYEVRKNYEKADAVFYLPADTPRNARRLVKLFKPRMAVFAKYDFWHHYLHTLKKQDIPVYAVSAVFRPGQRFFRFYGAFFRRALRCFTLIFVQDEASRLLLAQEGISSVRAGDTRFDRVASRAAQARDLPAIQVFAGTAPLLVAGSTWEPEEKILARYLSDAPRAMRVLIAPHDISEAHLRAIEQKLPGLTLRYSQFSAQAQPAQPVLLIDNIGLLASVYRYADIALVGGGFSGRLHNILEPAAFGAVVLFGPEHRRFHEAQQLQDAGGAFVVRDVASFSHLLELLLGDKELLLTHAQQAREFVSRHKGATEKILTVLLKKIEL